MRMMLRVRIPVEAGNVAFTDGSLGKGIQQAIDTLHRIAHSSVTPEGRRRLGTLTANGVQDTVDLDALRGPPQLIGPVAIGIATCSDNPHVFESHQQLAHDPKR